MSSLLADYAGKVKLIYIDPPFDTGADFSLRMKIGDSDFTKAPSYSRSTLIAIRGDAVDSRI